MIILIVNSIELHNGNDPGWLEYPEMRRQKEQAYDVASKLLSDLEEAGMLPPPIYGEQYSECPENNWEPEND